MAFKMSGWSAFTKKDDKNKATEGKEKKPTPKKELIVNVARSVLQPGLGEGGEYAKKREKAKSETALEFMRKERRKDQPANVRARQDKVKLDRKKVTKVERSEKSKRMEEQRKKMKKQ